MSRFYVNIQGNRGGASRQGIKSSGIHSHTRGWDIGIEVDGFVNDNNEDCFRVYVTSGSNASLPKCLIGEYTRKDYYELIGLDREDDSETPSEFHSKPQSGTIG